MQRSLLVSLIVMSTLLLAGTARTETAHGMAKATFAVHCYDVGVSALKGKPGVVSVERGWSGVREVDRVVYDPQRVSLMQLEKWLKEADTYISTLETSMGKEPAKEMSQ